MIRRIRRHSWYHWCRKQNRNALPQIDADNAAGIKYQPKKLDAAAITDSPEAFECSRPRIRTGEDLGYLHSGARPQQETVMTNAEFAR
jgi:hypothetical protein